MSINPGRIRNYWPGSKEVLLLTMVMVVDVVLFSDLMGRNPTLAGGPRTPRAVVIGCAVLLLVALLRRGRAPVTTALLVCGGSVISTLLTSYRPILPVCVALATVVSRSSKVSTVIAMLASLLAAVSWVFGEDRLHRFTFATPELIGVQLGYLVILAVGAGVGGWRRTLERLNDHRRDEATRTAVRDERRRMARELHDIVAQAVTLMVLQASGARVVMEAEPDRARDALDVVEKTGTQAMAELRRLLSVLRSPGDDLEWAGEDPESPVGLDELPTLLQSVRATGVVVAVEREGQPQVIDRSVDAAAYRIISESLTNVTKHSGVGATARVRIRWQSDRLEIEVSDNGAGSGRHEKLSTGNGLISLTERVILVGGAFEARPRTTGGYEVHATLPLPKVRLSSTSAPAAV